MNLTPDFHFSQSSLQDYVDCRRRFQLRYLLKIAWPAVELEPVIENERRLERGAQFHRLVQQYLIGLDPLHLSNLAQGSDLQRWWDNFCRFVEDPQRRPKIVGSGINCHTEISLAAPIENYRIIAKYDAIVLSEDGNNLQVTIFDWKTSRKRLSGRWLANRLQTRLYPYLLVRAGASLNHGVQIQPEQLEMIYWFADFPDDPERFQYNSANYEQDDQFLSCLVQEIANLPEDEFFLTSQENHCRFCTYRSLCDRGVKAGILDAEEYDQLSDDEIQQVISILDFEQITEIEF